MDIKILGREALYSGDVSFYSRLSWQTFFFFFVLRHYLLETKLRYSTLNYIPTAFFQNSFKLNYKILRIRTY
jgi:hypothetical protein